MSGSIFDIVPTIEVPKIWTPDDTSFSLETLQSQSSPQYLNKGKTDLDGTKVMKLWRHKPKYFFSDVMGVTLYDWQEDVVEAYLHNQRVGMIACKGPGKEQPVSTLIETPSGQKVFGSLVPGDLVFSEYGVPTKVLSIHPQGVKDVYEVIFDDGSKTQCGLEHLWKVRGRTEKRNKCWTVINLKEIMAKGVSVKQGKSKYRQFQIPNQEAVHFPEASQDVSPYVLGIWLGDGTRGKEEYTSIDDEIMEHIKSLGYSVVKKQSKDRAPNIKVIGIKEHLKKLNLIDKYSYEKRIPEIFKYASIEQRLELLRGLMDSDGTVDGDDSCTEFASTSLGLVEDVMWTVRSLGGKAKAGKPKRSFIGETEHRLCYRVRFSLTENPFRLSRKAQKWKKPTQERYLQRTIVEVRKVGEEESMCITVACPNRCYLTNDFIVTHNTFTLSALGLHMMSCFDRPKIAALSITKDHLMSNLWAELCRWIDHDVESNFLKLTLKTGADRIKMIGYEEYSFIDARSFPKAAEASQMQSALAGLHAPNVGFLIDEGGRIPDAVLATADAALSTGDSPTKRARLLVTANPEVPSGTLYRAYRGDTKQPWKIIRVTGDPDDPKRATNVSVGWAREQIAAYGRENPWTKVNVFAEYPETAAEVLLTEEEIDKAMNRQIEDLEVRASQLRLGVDVSRGGVDDTKLVRRRGLKVYPLEGFGSGNDGPTLAGIIAHRVQTYKIERVFVDNTGGYGSSCVDSLKTSHAEVDTVPVVANASAQDSRYFNKRHEMYFRLRDHVRRGGNLPYDLKLKEELAAITTYPQGSFIRILEKAQIKSKIGRSPDSADAIAQTFADVETESNDYWTPEDLYRGYKKEPSKYHVSSSEDIDAVEESRYHQRYHRA